MLCSSVSQILPPYQGKETALNYYCNHPFLEYRELKENCSEVKLKALGKQDTGILQISCLQGWLFKCLVKLTPRLFLFMDFPFNFKFKLIKGFSNTSVNPKCTICMSCSVYGETVMNKMLFSIIYKYKLKYLTLPNENISYYHARQYQTSQYHTILLYRAFHAQTAPYPVNKPTHVSCCLVQFCM